ncbi:M15 family metallopeptidase [Microbacterium sp. Root180]|uniref:M15 family metallopeptidase n=1 Tax=Microbacterium sp. Root180 TaxID=1736483 RepID=UPI0006F5AFA6|nr:M15 family metallopeptidase [Microbacterium sp. Root180]KRB38415.1 D-alanyl-D-alanine carboxypeptidase [Microbacterium sp. Root180]
MLDRRLRLRRLVFLSLGVGVAAFLAVLVVVGVRATTAAASGPFLPSEAAGHIVEGAAVTLAEGGLPAIAKLDAALLDAMRQAETDAAADGVAFDVTSGWRSARYQQWLLDDAIERYGSEELARQYVATPDGSRHVTGDAIDIGSLDAQLWLSQHGWRYGICQTYANERWHFELATEPGGTCPEMKADAAS